MVDYNKTEIREQLTLENIFDLLQDWGGDPEYTAFGILCSTYVITSQVKEVESYITMKIVVYSNVTLDVKVILTYLKWCEKSWIFNRGWSST